MRIALIISLLISFSAPAFADRAAHIEAQKRALAASISDSINNVLKD